MIWQKKTKHEPKIYIYYDNDNNKEIHSVYLYYTERPRNRIYRRNNPCIKIVNFRKQPARYGYNRKGRIYGRRIV